MQYRIVVAEARASFPCRDDQSVLGAMRLAGAACVQVGCRGGGCGVCRVQVESGVFDTGTMSGAQISADDRAKGIVLACQLYPRSDLCLRALGSAGAGSIVAALKE